MSPHMKEKLRVFGFKMSDVPDLHFWFMVYNVTPMRWMLVHHCLKCGTCLDWGRNRAVARTMAAPRHFEKKPLIFSDGKDEPGSLLRDERAESMDSHDTLLGKEDERALKEGKAKSASRGKEEISWKARRQRMRAGAGLAAGVAAVMVAAVALVWWRLPTMALEPCVPQAIPGRMM